MLLMRVSTVVIHSSDLVILPKVYDMFQEQKSLMGKFGYDNLGRYYHPITKDNLHKKYLVSVGLPY